MTTIIAFYKFVTIEDLPVLRKQLQALTNRLSLRGTILIATEGINSTISGSKENIQQFKEALTSDSRFADIVFKESFYDDISFRRMLVKIKKEIVTLKVGDQQVSKSTGAYLPPQEFKKWKEEGKEMILVDTRNDYEYKLGTFKGALNPKTNSFGEFPKWLHDNLSDKKDKTIVTFCTGGIRCEKATAYMKNEGYKNVYQIEGGILNYFKEVQDTKDTSHWTGDCVVFDKRHAIQPNLSASQKEICYICLSELKKENKSKNTYPAGKICLACDDKLIQNKERRQALGRLKQIKNKQARIPYQKKPTELEQH